MFNCTREYDNSAKQQVQGTKSRSTIGPLPSSAVNVVLNVSGDAMDNRTVILFKM